MVDPISKEFKITYDEQNFGLPLKQALFNLVERVPLLDLKFFVTAVLMQKETGGNLAEILTNLSHVIRERFKIMGEVRTFSAQGRLTGYILTAVPIAMGFILSVMNWDYMSALFKEKIGHYMLGVAGFCQVLGYIIIRKIVKIKV
jgi:tight adherence protein B